MTPARRPSLAAALAAAAAQEEMRRRFPAERQVMIDDKPRLLSAVKAVWGSQVTTVFPRQDKFAFDAALLAEALPADVTVPQIGDQVDADLLARLTGE